MRGWGVEASRQVVISSVQASCQKHQIFTRFRSVVNLWGGVARPVTTGNGKLLARILPHLHSSASSPSGEDVTAGLLCTLTRL